MPTKDNSVYIMRQQIYWLREQFSPGGGVQGGAFKLTRSRTGVSNPNWRKQVEKQQNATTAMSGTFEDYSLFSKGSSTFLTKNVNDFNDQKVYRNTARGDFSTGTVSWSPTITVNTANNRALISYLKAVRATMQGFSSLTFLGELRETIAMIRNPAQGLRNLMDSYLDECRRRRKALNKRYKPDKAKREWKKNLSSIWLEQAFGWQPLINDIQNAHKAYKDLVDPNRNRQVPVRGYGVEEKYVSAQSSFQEGSAPVTSCGKHDVTQRAVERAVVTYRGMVVRRVETIQQEALNTFGFTANDFIPTAWELLPWSFLVDYFTNIGDCLEAWTTDTTNLAWTNRTDIIFKEREYMSTPNEEATKASVTRFVGFWGAPCHSKLRNRTVNRTPGVAIGTPTIALELPGRPAQWTNMLALFTQVSGDPNLHPQRRPWRR